MRGFALIALLLVSACAGGAPSGTPGPALTEAAIRQQLVDTFGPLWFCDPDQFPVGRDEAAAAREHWPEVVADPEALVVLGAALGIDLDGDLDDGARLAIYRAWKTLNAVPLEPDGNEGYRFDYLAQPAAGATDGRRVVGTVRRDGVVTVEQEVRAGEPVCPICLPRGTTIESPGGSVAVETLRIGDPVWTLDAAGARTPAVVIATGSTITPADHSVVRVELTDGRVVSASPGHPLADGRPIGDLRVGDPLDGSTVRSVLRVRYGEAATFDIAVSGPTGIYLSGGIAFASTLD